MRVAKSQVFKLLYFDREKGVLAMTTATSPEKKHVFSFVIIDDYSHFTNVGYAQNQYKKGKEQK